MAQHKFHGRVQIQPGTQSNEAVTKNQLDLGIAQAQDLANSTGSITSAQVSDFNSAVNTLIEQVVDAEGATDALDTLKELAEALGNDPDFAATITGQLGALDGRIDALEANSGTGGFKSTVGDNTQSSFTVAHGLGTTDITTTVIELSTGQTVFPVVTRPDSNNVVVDFGSFVPTNASHRVLVQPV